MYLYSIFSAKSTIYTYNYVRMSYNLIKKLLREEIRSVLNEVLFGKAMDVKIGENKFKALVSKNVKPDQLPYRITLFKLGEDGSLVPERHVQISEDEAMYIVNNNLIPNRVQDYFLKKYGAKLDVLKPIDTSHGL